MSNRLQRNALHGLILLAIAAILSNCASSPSIITNADPSTDFSTLKSFNFWSPLSTDSGNIQTLLSTHLIAATTDELEKLGWRHDQSDPDVLINFHMETQQQIRTRSTSASIGTMHHGGRYGSWGATMSTPTIEQTTQGALSIDMIDPTRNQMIWEGTTTNRVTDKIRENPEESVRMFVAAILAEFP
jgi:hypothetical protein